MKKFNFHYFPRDFEAGDFIENFLISTVVSILAIRVVIVRTFTAITGQSYIGNEQFHIAHMLWGGFILMFTILGLLVFLNRETKWIAAITSGIGFGTFIDELGKFITQDNNYFYQPTIALIYVILVLIFLAARVFEKYFKLTQTEYTINALELVKNVVMHDLDSEEKQRALYFLKHSSKEDIVSNELEKILIETRAIPVGKPTLFHKIKENLKSTYLKLVHYKYFINLIIVFFITASIANFFSAIINFKNIDDFADWGQLVFSIVSGLLVIIGAIFLVNQSSKKIGYQLFKYAVLVSIFLTQFFRFLQDQLSAITVLLLSLVVFSVLQYLIYEDDLLTKDSS